MSALVELECWYDSVLEASTGKTVICCRFPKCEYRTDKNSNFKRHFETMHKLLDPPLICCEISFVTKGEYRHHTRSTHMDGHICPFCCKIFNRKALLQRHMSVHTGNKPFSCTVCDYKSANKANVIRHLPIHSSSSGSSSRASFTDNDNDSFTSVTPTPKPLLSHSIDAILSSSSRCSNKKGGEPKGSQEEEEKSVAVSPSQSQSRKSQESLMDWSHQSHLLATLSTPHYLPVQPQAQAPLLAQKPQRDLEGLALRLREPSTYSLSPYYWNYDDYSYYSYFNYCQDPRIHVVVPELSVLHAQGEESNCFYRKQGVKRVAEESVIPLEIVPPVPPTFLVNEEGASNFIVGSNNDNNNTIEQEEQVSYIPKKLRLSKKFESGV